MLRRRIGQVILVVGLCALILGAWAGAQYRTATAFGAFFVDPFGMALGADGRVYVGMDGRNVHAYDEFGRPVSAWTVDQDAGRFRLRVLPSEQVEVAVERGDLLHLYEPDGRLAESSVVPGVFEDFGPENDRRVESAEGAVFEIRDDGLVRTRPEPEQIVVRAPAFPLTLLGTRPIQPLSAVMMVGAVGLLVGTVLTAMPASRGAKEARA